MIDGYRIFDTHTHMGQARHSGRSVSPDDLLRTMDESGADRAVVIPFPVVENYRCQHDLIGLAARAHPGRLLPAVCLHPMLPLAEFREEVRRCRQEYGARALKLQPQYHGLNPASSASGFFFETALENEMAVIVHTGTGGPFAMPSHCMIPARQYPGLTIVLAHSGGGIFVQEAIIAAVFCPNIILEMSSLMPHHVLDVIAQVTADRLMIGSDLPESAQTEFGKILSLNIPPEQKRQILDGTGCRVFGGC